ADPPPRPVADPTVATLAGPPPLGPRGYGCISPPLWAGPPPAPPDPRAPRPPPPPPRGPARPPPFPPLPHPPPPPPPPPPLPPRRLHGCSDPPDRRAQDAPVPRRRDRRRPGPRAGPGVAARRPGRGRVARGADPARLRPPGRRRPPARPGAVPERLGGGRGDA